MSASRLLDMVQFLNREKPIVAAGGPARLLHAD
jgi:hypothetical protein